MGFPFFFFLFLTFLSFYCFQVRNGQTKPTVPFLGGAFTVHGVFQMSLISERTWTWESKHKHMYSHPGNGFQKGVGARDPPPHAVWALATISHLTHPLTPSWALPSLPPHVTTCTQYHQTPWLSPTLLNK